MRILSAWAAWPRYRVWLCIPAIAYALVALLWHVNGTDVLTGDETFYLMVTESIVGDSDVDVSNNLRQHGYTSPGWIESHSVETPRGWFSVHNIGLSAFVALPWALCGPLGARLTMAMSCGLAAPLLFRVIERIWRSPPNSSAIVIALALGMPFLNASSQFYPDLLAGVLLLFAADCALARADGIPVAGWRELLLSVGLAVLPWLHIKYAAAAMVGLGWYIDAARRREALAVAAAFAVSLALLATYNNYAFGKPAGPYGNDALVIQPTNNLIVFLGLHFDQSQGMFMQQPLWLLGLVGLVPMWRASHRTALWWLLMYAAVIVPNALHPTWYGGNSFVGRFGSTNVLLWAIPLAHGARAVFTQHSYLPRVFAGFSLAFQAMLANSWWWGYENRLNFAIWEFAHAECVWAYHSIYPAMIKTYLPYWQPFSEFWHYPANLSALLLAAGAITSGWLWQARRRRAIPCLSGAVLLAIGLPLVAGIRMPLVVFKGDKIRGYIGSSDGKQFVAEEGRDERGVLARTPALFLAPGSYRVSINYQAEGDARDAGVVILHNQKNATGLCLMQPAGAAFVNDCSFCISNTECKSLSCVAVYYTGRGRLSVASLSIEKMTR